VNPTQPAPADHALDAEFGVQEPLPDEARDDEAEREGIEDDGAERVLEPDLLVHQGGEQEADDEAQDERAGPVDHQVLDRDDPAVRAPEPFILREAHEVQSAAGAASR
jgi:hypothetical protein